MQGFFTVGGLTTNTPSSGQPLEHQLHASDGMATTDGNALEQQNPGEFTSLPSGVECHQVWPGQGIWSPLQQPLPSINAATDTDQQGENAAASSQQAHMPLDASPEGTADAPEPSSSSLPQMQLTLEVSELEDSGLQCAKQAITAGCATSDRRDRSQQCSTTPGNDPAPSMHPMTTSHLAHAGPEIGSTQTCKPLFGTSVQGEFFHLSLRYAFAASHDCLIHDPLPLSGKSL